MVKLFARQPSQLVADMIAVAALSGMRVEEIERLTVGDIFRDCFDIPEAKTDAGVRMVPIHSALQPIVARRTAGKGATEPLFPELPIPAPGSAIERSQKVVKAFTAYRRKLGLDDVPEGARQSRVDFHSFRRWFMTKAEQAHQPPPLHQFVGWPQANRRDPRGCYGLVASTAACLSMMQANATTCRPARVLAYRS